MNFIILKKIGAFITLMSQRLINLKMSKKIIAFIILMSQRFKKNIIILFTKLLPQIKEICSTFYNRIPNRIKEYILTPIAGVSYISIFLLIFISPVYSVIWLVGSTFFFIYRKEYRSIYTIWFITLTIWYFIFTTTLSEIPIIIGFGHTEAVLLYLIRKKVFFANLCFQTVVILHVCSAKIGFPLYIPAFVNVIKAIIFFFEPKPPTNCGKEENTDSSKQKSETDDSEKNSEKKSTSRGYIFWPSSSDRVKLDAAIDRELCNQLTDKFVDSTDLLGMVNASIKTNGKRTVEQVIVNMPLFQTFSYCSGRGATYEEAQKYKEDKDIKNSK